jgi:hypothetical protein
MNWIYILGGLLMLAAILAGKKPTVGAGLAVVAEKAQAAGSAVLHAAEGLAEVITAPGAAPGSIKYPDGTVKNGGPSSWRANNPGNITYSEWAWKYAGAFKDSKLQWGKLFFAVFPSEAVGLAALRLLLTSGRYPSDTVYQGMARYLGWMKETKNADGTYTKVVTPPAGSIDDPTAYAAGIAAAVGVGTSTIIGSLDSGQIDKFVAKIRAIEGWDANGPDGHKGTITRA